MHATNKPFNIDKRLVYEVYKAVKSNRGGAGVDEQSIEQFEEDLAGNLYKIWNRMSSGTYFPPQVRDSAQLPVSRPSAPRDRLRWARPKSFLHHSSLEWGDAFQTCVTVITARTFLDW